jgi:hypothetical protein
MQDRTAIRRSEAGFSVIEGLIAAALLLIITVGVLPLISRSMLNNVKGNDATRQSNGTVDEFERTLSLPFFGGETSLQGAATTLTTQNAIGMIHLPGGQQTVSANWEPYAALAPADVVLRKTSTMRQYETDEYAIDQTFDDPLPGSTEPRRVNLKVFDLVFEEPLNSANSQWRTHYTVRLVKAY